MTTSCTITSDQGSLAALLDLPDTKEYPIVVLLHGFTGWKEEEHISSLAKALCERGMGTVRYDAPGSGESEGTFAAEYRMTNYLASVKSVIEFAKKELGATKESTGIWGHSMGGFIAIASQCLQNDCAAVCASQSSIGKRGFTEAEVEPWRTTGWASFPNEYFTALDLPYEFHVDRQQYDIFEMIGNLKAPLFLISGTFDELAPVSQVKAIYEAAPDPKTYREFRTGHDYKFDEEQLAAINSATVDFFAGYLLPGRSG